MFKETDKELQAELARLMMSTGLSLTYEEMIDLDAAIDDIRNELGARWSEVHPVEIPHEAI